MNIGMLWFDNDPKSELDVKIARATSYYQQKYGRIPNLCFIHPTMIPGSSNEPEKKLVSGPVEVRANQAVLPNHFWIGVTAA